MDRFQNYFEYNGKRCGTGTIIIIRDNGQERKAAFVCYDKQVERYRCRFKDCQQDHNFPKKTFYENIVEILDEVDDTVKEPRVRQRRDSEIEGLIDGWICYIVFMAVSIIFRPLLGWWLFESYIFFSWRNNKIKKAGVHIDW